MFCALFLMEGISGKKYNSALPVPGIGAQDLSTLVGRKRSHHQSGGLGGYQTNKQ